MDHTGKQPNPFQILNVTPKDSFKDIKTAFRKLCLQTHPDKNDGSAVSHFVSAKWAFDELSDPIRRKKWEHLVETHERARMPFHDRFLYGSSSKADAKIKQRHLVTVKVTFSEAFTGVTKGIDVNQQVPCECVSRATMPPEHVLPGMPDYEISVGCRRCNNTKKVWTTTSHNVQIPHGCFTGYKFFINDCNADVVVEVLPPEADCFGEFYVQRQHNHLYYTLKRTVSVQSAPSLQVLNLVLPDRTNLKLDVTGLLLARMIPIVTKPHMYQTVLQLRQRGFRSCSAKFPVGNLYVIIPITTQIEAPQLSIINALRPENIAYVPFESDEERSGSDGCAQQ